MEIQKEARSNRVIYLLGAGRSGTTLLAAMLHAHPEIHTLGEMHQFLEFLAENKNCSCGQHLNECPFWGPVSRCLSWSESHIEKLRHLSKGEESHSKIPLLLFGKKPDKRYLESNRQILRSSKKISGSEVLLDSSKYISRFLLLNGIPEFQFKGVYMIRDVRGVVDSFGKNVQTPKTPLASLLYYGLINLFGELTYRLSDNVVKIKYEDFINNPQKELEKILKHAGIKNASEFRFPDEFEMPHIVGGNRMKSKATISISSIEAWRSRLPRLKQIIYYLMVWPIMLFNRYKL